MASRVIKIPERIGRHSVHTGRMATATMSHNHGYILARWYQCRREEVVSQQPFGGSRTAGTNDKAGSVLNLILWVSPHTIKKTFNPLTHFAYPHMQPD